MFKHNFVCLTAKPCHIGCSPDTTLPFVSGEHRTLSNTVSLSPEWFLACRVHLQSGSVALLTSGCLSQGNEQHQNPSAVLNCSLNHSFADLYNNTLLSDVTLKAGDCQVHAHKIILAAQSPSFKAMFQVQLPAQYHQCCCFLPLPLTMCMTLVPAISNLLLHVHEKCGLS